MDSETYLIDEVKIKVDNKFTITIELFRQGEENDDMKIYLIDVHIGGELWALGTSKSIALVEAVARAKFEEFVNIAENIKTAFEDKNFN